MPDVCHFSRTCPKPRLPRESSQVLYGKMFTIPDHLIDEKVAAHGAGFSEYSGIYHDMAWGLGVGGWGLGVGGGGDGCVSRFRA